MLQTNIHQSSRLPTPELVRHALPTIHQYQRDRSAASSARSPSGDPQSTSKSFRTFSVVVPTSTDTTSLAAARTRRSTPSRSGATTRAAGARSRGRTGCTSTSGTYMARPGERGRGGRGRGEMGAIARLLLAPCSLKFNLRCKKSIPTEPVQKASVDS